MGWIPMVRRSILSSFREKQLAGAEEAQSSPGAVNELTKPVKPSRQAKLHIGGYFDPDDRTIVAFQKVKSRSAKVTAGNASRSIAGFCR